MPPKYLTTIHKILLRLFFNKTFKIGIPAVPLGSLSSLDLLILFII